MCIFKKIGMWSPKKWNVHAWKIRNVKLGFSDNFPALMHHGKDMFPSKILCFFVDKDDSVCALVHTTTNYDYDASSSLCEIWQQEYMPFRTGERNNGVTMLKPVIHKIPVDSLERRIYVFEECPGIREAVNPDRFQDSIPRVTVVLSQDVWPSRFTLSDNSDDE